MAYAHQMVDFPLNNAAVALAVADPMTGAGRLVPGYTRGKVRAICATIAVVTGAAIATLTFKFRPTPGSAAGEVILGTLSLPIGAVVGKCYYRDSGSLVPVANTQITPGGEIVVQGAGAATGSVILSVLLEPMWEHPSNVPNMIETT